MQLTISHDFEQLAGATRKAISQVRPILLRTMLQTDLLLQRETIDRTPVGVGGGSGLRGSFSTRERMSGSLIVLGEMGTPLPYAGAIESGRAPGPISQAGMESLRDWVRAKLGVPDKEVPGVAFIIGRKIRRKGFKGKEMVKSALRNSDGQIQSFWQRAAMQIAQAMGAA
jgi:hypothetical protein